MEAERKEPPPLRGCDLGKGGLSFAAWERGGMREQLRQRPREEATQLFVKVTLTLILFLRLTELTLPQHPLIVRPAPPAQRGFPDPPDSTSVSPHSL